jgi:hypothetical protein
MGGAGIVKIDSMLSVLTYRTYFALCTLGLLIATCLQNQ